MFFTNRIIKIVSFCLVGLLLSSCVKYRGIEFPVNPPPSFEKNYILLIWTQKGKSKTNPKKSTLQANELFMKNITIAGDTLTGFVYNKPNKKHIKNQISVYIDDSIAQPDSIPSPFSLPVSAIQKIETYEVNVGTTILTSILGIATTTLTIAIICVGYLIIYQIVTQYD
ncbi:MAG TPA: hypothetical protein PKM80_03730 [Candidatus Cloacimonas sp.]|nr:hypothetical protein [Candidatus Cloacimonas sp.]